MLPRTVSTLGIVHASTSVYQIRDNLRETGQNQKGKKGHFLFIYLGLTLYSGQKNQERAGIKSES